MSTIYTRATKGSALTWTEGDANITNLNNDKIEDIVEDTTPQLGGNLDVNGNAIVSTSNADINITPNGTGRVVLSGQKFPAGSTAITGTVTDVDAVRDPNTVTLSNPTGVNSNAVITFTGSGVTSLGLSVGVEYKIWADIGGGAFELALNSGGGTIAITDPGTITDVNYSVAGAGATNGQLLSYNSSGLQWVNAPTGGIASVSADSNPSLGGNLNVNDNDITGTFNGNINIAPQGSGNINLTPATGYIQMGGLSFPSGMGSNGQVLTTNGSSAMSWSTVSGGISDVVEDTTPQLGGNLDVNGQQIVSASNGNIVIAPNGTGTVILDGLSWPTADGSANQVIKTDGAGNLSFVTPSSGGETVAYLNVTGNSLISGTTYRKTLTVRSDANNLVGTISSNAFNLSPGEYCIEIPTFTSTAASGYNVRLYGNTSSRELTWNDSGVVSSRSLIPGSIQYFTVGATENLELRSYSGTTNANTNSVRIARISTSLPAPTSTQDTSSVTASASGGPFSTGGWTTSSASNTTGSRRFNNPSYTFGADRLLGGGTAGTLDFWLRYFTGGASGSNGTTFLANDTIQYNQLRGMHLWRQNYNNQFGWSDSGGSELRNLGNLASDTWHHFSLQTSGNNTWYAWVNGNYKGSFSNGASFNAIHIGSAGMQNNTWPWAARFSNIRWSSSQRYTVSSNFSVPTSAYNWDANTVMLFRGADNNPTVS